MKVNDVIKEAEYTDIILSLLAEPYQIVSMTKIIFFSFCIYNENNWDVYKNRRKDFTDIFFENISLKLMTNYKDIEGILNVVDILVKTNKIMVVGDEIDIIEKVEHYTENKFIKRCNKKVPNPILEINKLDAIAVMEEVIRYV
ncbi:MAG: hypothetical protein LUD07_01840 [Clostridiales bacterium]|nr:hypothetical protein [Clostridiales bacterium]